ncbi:alkane 1-monooxygenase AlkB2 [soil metagenome]
MRNYKYFWSLTPGAATIFGNIAGGWWGMGNFIFSLGLLAFIEWFFPEDKNNDSSGSDFIPDFILVLHVIVQTLALSSLFYAIHENKFVGWQIFWACVSTGIHSGSSSIVVAHEMIHRKQTWWQWMGKYLLFTAGNIYFFIEHLRVHHKHVGTQSDPATAKYNESLYSFFFRTTVHQIMGAWRLESDRLHKEKKPVIHFTNYLIASIFLLVVLLSVLYNLFGIIAVIAFLVQAVIANFLLEYTNYIEHYGLSRNENERVTEIHSWQSDKVISRFILIDLSRHSDHHYYASKPYHELISYKKSPVLPGGYASAIYMALIPPLWFNVMNARIADYHNNVPAEV